MTPPERNAAALVVAVQTLEKISGDATSNTQQMRGACLGALYSIRLILQEGRMPSLDEIVKHYQEALNKAVSDALIAVPPISTSAQ